MSGNRRDARRDCPVEHEFVKRDLEVLQGPTPKRDKKNGTNESDPEEKDCCGIALHPED